MFFWRLTRKKIKTRPVAVLFILLSLAAIINYDALNLRMATAAARYLPDLELSAAIRRLLVIAPHPDDETLGAGGLLAGAISRGDRVKVVFMTNGDGFRRGVERFNGPGLLPAGADDYLQYGRMRQQEAIKALNYLGVKARDITFLGYPDGGLAPIWNGYWETGKPYTSRYTRRAAVPYRLAFKPGHPYTAPALLNTLVEILREYRPTDIYVTDTNDSHPDHWATGAFTLAAVGIFRGEDATFRPQLYSFVIHNGMWQMLPVVDRKDKPLLPPTYFLARGTSWYKLPLTATELDRKQKALTAYRSQELVMPTFLANFKRPNEIFCRLAEQQVPRAGESTGWYGEASAWPEGARVAFDPGGDVVTRKLERGGDLKAVYLLQGGTTTFLRLDTWGRAGAPVTYTVKLYLLPDRAGGQVRRFAWQIVPGSEQIRWLERPDGYNPGTLQAVYRSQGLEMALPGLIPSGEHYLMLTASTAIGKISLDRIPWQLVRVREGGI